MLKVKTSALVCFEGIAPSLWFRYMNDPSVEIRTEEVEAFMDHINTVDSNIKLIREDVKGHSLVFLDCAVHIEHDRRLNIENRESLHTQISI